MVSRPHPSSMIPVVYTPNGALKSTYSYIVTSEVVIPDIVPLVLIVCFIQSRPVVSRRFSEAVEVMLCNQQVQLHSKAVEVTSVLA